MPSPKRWFPVSHDFNRDPELWALTSKYGDRALRTWFEILSQLDLNNNELKVSSKWLETMQRITGQRLASVQLVLKQAVHNGWLAVKKELSNDLVTVYTSPNYIKYHRTREPNKEQHGKPKGDKLGSLLDYPNLSEPNKENIYILITGFSLSPELKAKAKAEGLPNPEANLPAFVEFHKDSGNRLRASWEYLYLTQLRYLAKHPEAQADSHLPNNGVCTFTPKTREQLEEFGESPCFESILLPSKLYCPRHYEYYQALIAKKTNNLLKNEQEGA